MSWRETQRNIPIGKSLESILDRGQIDGWIEIGQRVVLDRVWTECPWIEIG